MLSVQEQLVNCHPGRAEASAAGADTRAGAGRTARGSGGVAQWIYECTSAAYYTRLTLIEQALETCKVKKGISQLGLGGRHEDQEGSDCAMERESKGMIFNMLIGLKSKFRKKRAPRPTDGILIC